MGKERMEMRSRKWRHKKYEQRKVSEKKKIEMKIFGKRTYHLEMAKTRKIMIPVKTKQNKKHKYERTKIRPENIKSQLINENNNIRKAIHKFEQHTVKKTNENNNRTRRQNKPKRVNLDNKN